MQNPIIALVFEATLALGTWAGTRARGPWPAFFIAWLATPFIGGLLALIVATCLPTYDRLGWLLLLEIPIIGAGIGIIAGIVATVIVRRRPA